MRIEPSSHFDPSRLLLFVMLAGLLCPDTIAVAGVGYGDSPSFSLDTTAISGTPAPDRSVICILDPCYPNPFNPRTTISYELREPARVHLAIYDLLGRRIRVIQDDEAVSEGRHLRIWDGSNHEDRPAAAGVYVCRIRAGCTVAGRRITLVK